MQVRDNSDVDLVPYLDRNRLPIHPHFARKLRSLTLLP